MRFSEKYSSVVFNPLPFSIPSELCFNGPSKLSPPYQKTQHGKGLSTEDVWTLYHLPNHNSIRSSSPLKLEGCCKMCPLNKISFCPNQIMHMKNDYRQAPRLKEINYRPIISSFFCIILLVQSYVHFSPYVWENIY